MVYTVYRNSKPFSFLPMSSAGFTAESVFVPDTGPEWKEAAFERLKEIRSLPDNWDGYGTRAVASALISKMAVMVKAIPDDEFAYKLPMPVISPASDGLQIEWNGERRGVEIILDFNGKESFVVEHEGKYEDGPISTGDSFAVISLLRSVFGEFGGDYHYPPSHNVGVWQKAVPLSLGTVAA